MIDKPWRDETHIRCQVEAVFEHVLQSRMAGLPLVNTRLRVQGLEFRRIDDLWAGILITPWFMNLLILPHDAVGWQTLQLGTKIVYSFPAGDFEFTVAHERRIGPYASCSLFSPMFQFDRQAVAIATAQAAWRALFIDGKSIDLSSSSARTESISRRALLRGRFGSNKEILNTATNE
ncbi:MAG: [NiFe]-hydrogenase assembly chaperone HybE [Gammaproteobacteria bacterium]